MIPTDEDTQDCPCCEYGPEFIDDGVPTRMVTRMCHDCEVSAEAAMGVFVRALEQVLGTPHDTPPKEGK